MNTSNCKSCSKKKQKFTCDTVPQSQKILRLWKVPIALNNEQVNAPIGLALAHKIASNYRLTPFTQEEFYKFLYGTSPNWPFKISRKEVIKNTVDCIINLTNTVGGVNNAISIISPFLQFKYNIPPLASYGLKFKNSSSGPVILSDCTTGQPCLTFNQYIIGPLQKICKDSGCLNKLQNVLRNPIFIQGARISASCQASTEGPCIWNDPVDGQSYGVPVSYAIWIVNFGFLYTLCPKIAAYIPKYRYRIPKQVASALKENSPNGVKWDDYKKFF